MRINDVLSRFVGLVSEDAIALAPLSFEHASDRYVTYIPKFYDVSRLHYTRTSSVEETIVIIE